ncbi:phosphoadenosine phosphosulfate reductase family protein [Kitasatospora sp. NPDC001540]|uniref:phosphoadenosine phosphosulfate reductase family protein n=1 Tax=Kitasatospora sp. NPDC001540 TaxID=3364014 RepID=UPI0036B45268
MTDSVQRLLEQLRLGIQSSGAVRTARNATRRKPKAGHDPRADFARLRAARRKAKAQQASWRAAWRACRGGVFRGPARQAADAVLAELAADPVDLVRRADALVFHSSGGKDSVVGLHRAVQAAKCAGCLHKLVVVHADLGPDTEWPGVRELAQRQAERYGLRFLVVAAEGGFVGMVEKRGMFPDSKRRLCTSTLKRDELAPIYTQITAALGLDDQALIVSVYGVRGGESAARAKKAALSLDSRASSGRRLVLTWNIVHHLSTAEVWQEISEHGLEYHPIYDTGLERLSCAYCILAPEAALVLATRVCFALGLSIPTVYVELERRIGHTFKPGQTLAGVVAAARMLDALDGPLAWRRGDAVRRHLGEEACRRWEQRLAVAT